MIRSLVEQLPVMVTPKWVRVKAQPIAIDDLLDYLVSALDLEPFESRVFEIGGADQVSYCDLMRNYAKQRGLHRPMIPVPMLTPWLSSLWLGLVTPLYARVARQLILSIRAPTVVHDSAALDMFPVRPRGMSHAIASAIVNEDQEIAETRWFDAMSSGDVTRSWTGVHFHNRIIDVRTAIVDVPPEQAFAPVLRLGGPNGWPYNWLWRVRGFLDLLVGGVGMRRGRPDPNLLEVGDALDFWRVEAYEPNRLLLLFAEMKLPGRAWLEFQVEGNGRGSVIRQVAMYDPVGVGGLLYWHTLRPIHAIVFAGMLKKLARAAVHGVA